MNTYCVKIENCNCISKAEIKIKKNSLNLKYGPNGTGKSTISKAISAQINNQIDELNELKPFNETHNPSVNCDDFQSVKVFNEDYVNSYLFTEKSFLDNSFRVFLHSKVLDDLSDETDKLLKELQSVFEQNENINGLKEFLPQYFDTIKYQNNSLSIRGGVAELIKGNGYGFEKYPELRNYSPFYKDKEFNSFSKWAKWRNDGSTIMNGEICPFCTNSLEMEKIQEQNKIIANVFKNSAISTANKVLIFLNEGIEKNYINIESVNALKEYIGDSNKSDELTSELTQLAKETEYLTSKINKICLFRPMNIKGNQIDEIESVLSNLIIDERQIPNYYTTKIVTDLIAYISLKINDLKQKTGKLKGLFYKCQIKTEELIKDREEDINHFFGLAGFPYKFIIKDDGENKSYSYLVPINLSEDKKVEKLETHLSWGEKNAFSLVMFMFEAISEGVDLIILDDPISSFDKNKKFSVIKRMFDNQKESFRDKTVIMFTHDMQPIIDYVYGKFFTRLGLTTPLEAMYLNNENGIIYEKEITINDLKNIVELTKEIATNPNQEMIVRCVNLRKYIELTNPNFSTSTEYEILSNIMHGRIIPIDKKGNELSKQIIEEGLINISLYIKNKNYKDFIKTTTDKNLFALLSSSDEYTKIIAIRCLFEKERDINLLSMLRKKYPCTCKFVNEVNHIENDYIFQLNPLVFFEIPQFYINQLQDFLINDSKLKL
ncbi:MAG: hypothetical protein EOL97_07030 [Spirochaetia bacterium]|nr:hypothetical protein [Spirochaetia bacterium]